MTTNEVIREENLATDEVTAPVFTYKPCVFVSDNQEYTVVFITDKPGMGYVTIADQNFYNTMNGTVKTASNVHKVRVPKELLDTTGEYTVNFKLIPDRKPYRPETTEHHTDTFKFRAPKGSDDLRAYFLSDTHSVVEAPARTALYYGDETNLLILCGDIGNTIKNLDEITTIHKIAQNVTKGEFPVLYARGNHDTRGMYAESLGDYIALSGKGTTYFTFEIGDIWGVVLDLGEDKEDSHVEYGDIAAYKDWRVSQTEFLEDIVNNKDKHYKKEHIKSKIAVCHIPFTFVNHPYSDAESSKWTELLNTIGIDYMLSGHNHRLYIREAGFNPYEKATPNFPVVIGSKMTDNPFPKDPEEKVVESKQEFTGTAIQYNKTENSTITVRFTNSKHEVLGEHQV